LLRGSLAGRAPYIDQLEQVCRESSHRLNDSADSLTVFSIQTRSPTSLTTSAYRTCSMTGINDRELSTHVNTVRSAVIERHKPLVKLTNRILGILLRPLQYVAWDARQIKLWIIGLWHLTYPG
jgi:hypothetical protein